MKRFAKQLIGASAVIAMLWSSPLQTSAASYTVSPGDSLWKISLKHGISIEALKQVNGLTSDMLLVGQRLLLPQGQENGSIDVQSDDTMWKIAVRHGVPLDKLIAANPQVEDPNNIWHGMTLNLPRKPDRFLNGRFPLGDGTYSAYTNTYADSRTWSPEGETVRKHEGVDIMAKEGTPIYSAVGGTIVKASWNTYGGWRITIRVDDNTEFYYAHMSKYASGMKVGVKVSAGELIGYVGSTGYGPEGTSGLFEPHLHFGIYTRTPSYSSIDPYLYLKWWELS